MSQISTLIKDNKYIVLAFVVVLICIAVSILESFTNNYSLSVTEVTGTTVSKEQTIVDSETRGVEEIEATRLLTGSVWQNESGQQLVFNVGDFKEYKTGQLISINKYLIISANPPTIEDEAWNISLQLDSSDMSFEVSVLDGDANTKEMIINGEAVYRVLDGSLSADQSIRDI
ncbi:hypothetical protein FACS1894104_2090 [Actinomycetota bacterium]|nr:hypothetical protein FACS1894104_2090 [Actinomycetota bacterium]